MSHWLEGWKIPNNNFYPVSIVSLVNQDHKGTTILVSSVDEVYSLVVAGELNHSVIRSNSLHSPPFTKCALEVSSGICGLKRTTTNAVALTTEGQLMVYESAGNKLACIDGLSDITHVDRGPGANLLYVVRRKEGQSHTVLEVVEGAGRFGCTTTRSYDLVADCMDSGARLCIRSFTIDETNRRFLGDFCGFSKLSNGEQLTMIAIQNQLYWLQQQSTGDNDLVTVRCFSSNVLEFEFCESSTSLTVLLAAGVLVVFNQSVHPDTLLISSSFVYLQAPIEAHCFDQANNSFLYSNGLGTHRVRYHFSEETKKLVIEAERIPVHGVVAITLIEHCEMAILVTENGLFYALLQTNQTRQPDKRSSSMVTLRREMQSVAERATILLTDEVEFDRRLDQAIQREQAHFQVLALHRNRNLFGKLSQMNVTYHREMPVGKSGIRVVEKHSKTAPCLFASLQIEINLGYLEQLVQQKRWTVYVEYGENVMMYPIHDTFNKQGLFHAIVFLNQSQLVRGLPVFRAFLFAAVRNGHDNLLLTTPVPWSAPPQPNAVHLIEKLHSFDSAPKETHSTRAAYRQLVQQCNPHPIDCSERSLHLSYCIQNEQSKTKAASFSSALENHPGSDSWSVCESLVNVRWERGRDALLLETLHPLPLDLVKRFLLQEDEYSAEMEQRFDRLKGICLELQAVSSTELILQLYKHTRLNDVCGDGLL